MNYDLIIHEAEIVDGTGAPAHRADLAVKKDRIVKIQAGISSPAKQEIDASRLTLAPGFIDSHSHADLTFLAGSAENEKLRMGVTTEMIGQCGFSPYPLSGDYRKLRRESMSGMLPGVSLDWSWNNLREYRALVEKNGATHHIVPLVGHGSIRQAVMGDRPKSPTVLELDRMQSLVEEAMKDGAYGLSTGLIYAPGCFSETPELIALARVAAEHHGYYVTHIRGETSSLIDAALEEALTVTRESGAPLEISHLKVIGLRPGDQGYINRIIKKIEEAQKLGLEIGFDCYPYTEGSTWLSSLLPKWAHEGGVPGLLENLSSPTQRTKIRAAVEADNYGGENWILACGFPAIKLGSLSKKQNQPFAGRDLFDIAREIGQDPFELLLDLLLDEKANIIMVFSMMRPEDMQTAITHPLAVIGTDAIPCPPGQGRPHPRGYGTFPNVLGRLARQQQLMTLEQAVHKMTGLPAQRWKLKDRGQIAEGMFADLVLFDREKIIDTADYKNPRQHPPGITHVWVEGALALENGNLTGVKAGRFI